MVNALLLYTSLEKNKTKEQANLDKFLSLSLSLRLSFYFFLCPSFSLVDSSPNKQDLWTLVARSVLPLLPIQKLNKDNNINSDNIVFTFFLFQLEIMIDYNTSLFCTFMNCFNVSYFWQGKVFQSLVVIYQNPKVFQNLML